MDSPDDFASWCAATRQRIAALESELFPEADLPLTLFTDAGAHEVSANTAPERGRWRFVHHLLYHSEPVPRFLGLATSTLLPDMSWIKEARGERPPRSQRREAVMFSATDGVKVETWCADVMRHGTSAPSLGEWSDWNDPTAEWLREELEAARAERRPAP